MKRARYRIIQETKHDGLSLYVVQRKAPWYDLMSFGHWSDYNVFSTMMEAHNCVIMLSKKTRTTYHYFDEMGNPIETGVTDGTAKPI